MSPVRGVGAAIQYDRGSSLKREFRRRWVEREEHAKTEGEDGPATEREATEETHPGGT